MSFQGFLDNCHVRVAFATNNERIARCVSDALGTTTELRAMNNHAGHRLSSWLGHLIENLTTYTDAVHAAQPGHVGNSSATALLDF
jgi:type IV secretory pathway TraG/TraD family ATPase VirD4